MKKKSLLVVLLLLVAVLVATLQAQTAGASYSFDGTPYADKLDLVAHGNFNGGVYVGESHKLADPPFTQTFAVPENVRVKWARLYVGVWGGTERYEGWVQTTLNGQDLGKTALRGVNDENPNVYCSGHGVYWVFYDGVAEKVKAGLNTATATTSRGERGNQLDGRIYSIILVAVYENGDGGANAKAPEISFWVADGNANLHGQGWTGKLATTNDFASVQFDGSVEPANVAAANLTVVYLAGNPGEPDYLEFNGQDLGGGEEVANCGDGETYGIDLKTFEVTKFLQATENRLLFLRGKDTNHDGKIDTDDEGQQEGEHYLHPVLAVLVVRHESTEKVLPDLSVRLEQEGEEEQERGEGGNLTEGENTLTAVVTNYGRSFEGDFLLKVSADESEIYSQVLQMDYSGIKKQPLRWNATHGTHTLKAEVTADSGGKSEVQREFFVLSSSDLSVRILTPVPAKGGEAEEKAEKTLKTPLLQRLLDFLLGKSEQAEAEPELVKYSVPVEVKNEGEAAARNFKLALYLDGEKTKTKKIEWLEGGESATEEFSIVVAEGKHHVRAVVDEEGRVKENEISFDF